MHIQSPYIALCFGVSTHCFQLDCEFLYTSFTGHDHVSNEWSTRVNEQGNHDRKDDNGERRLQFTFAFRTRAVRE